MRFKKIWQTAYQGVLLIAIFRHATMEDSVAFYKTAVVMSTIRNLYLSSRLSRRIRRAALNNAYVWINFAKLHQGYKLV